MVVNEIGVGDASYRLLLCKAYLIRSLKTDSNQASWPSAIISDRNGIGAHHHELRLQKPTRWPTFRVGRLGPLGRLGRLGRQAKTRRFLLAGTFRAPAAKKKLPSSANDFLICVHPRSQFFPGFRCACRSAILSTIAARTPNSPTASAPQLASAEYQTAARRNPSDGTLPSRRRTISRIAGRTR